MASPKKRKSERSHEWEVEAKHELAVWRQRFHETKSLVHAHWCCSAEGGGSALYQKPVEFQTYSCGRWEEIWGLGKAGGTAGGPCIFVFLLENAKWSGIRVSEIAKDPIQLYMESAQAKVDKATEVDLPCLTCCSIMNLEDGRKKTWAMRLVQNRWRVGPPGRTNWTTVMRQQWTAPAAQNRLLDSDFRIAAHLLWGFVHLPSLHHWAAPSSASAHRLDGWMCTTAICTRGAPLALQVA